MPEFPHLKLPFQVKGLTKSPKGGKRTVEARDRTNSNKQNRQLHGEYLISSADAILNNWNNLKSESQVNGRQLPNEIDIPMFLKIDTEVFDIERLNLWGIEIISEEENGFIIGASTDNLEAFKENVNDFINERGIRKNKASQIWELITDDSWRVNNLLKGDLLDIWDEINYESTYVIEIGISCYIPNKTNYPVREEFVSELLYQQEVVKFYENEKRIALERDEKQILREAEISRFIEMYSGSLIDIWDNEVDAIYFKLSLNGQGLKDLVHTYQYLFEVKLDTCLVLEQEQSNFEEDFEAELIPPDPNASSVCVIDSGIQETHRLIAVAIDFANSRSYIEDDTSTADHVRQNGHGTKVAGAVLYPKFIPTNGQFKLECFIQNARILNSNNMISDKLFAPKLMEQIISDYSDTKIFNLSVTETCEFIDTHMSSLAASIDKLIHEEDVLFIIAAGNVNIGAITNHLQSGTNYPHYLDESESRIASPGVSSFAITVGSIAIEDFENDDYKAMAGKHFISPFSRSGLGLWGSIKPDVVEFGGDYLKNKLSTEIITHESTSPELVNSTLYGANAVGRDSCGTSFSTPKVSYIASRLQTEHPEESTQMYRALIIQSARLPDHCIGSPTLNDFRYFGYGIPDINRALGNSEGRITFIQNGSIKPKNADIYHLKIPDNLKGEGRDFRVLVEVTLTFTARTRITREGAHQYLSSWLEWKSSKYNETFNNFRNRTIEYLENNNDTDDTPDIDASTDSIRWVIRENPAWTNNGINRNNSTAQKSWAIIEPHQFADEFSIAIIGHIGWDKNLANETEYSLCVSFEVLDTHLNIYELLSRAQVEIEPEQEIELQS
ncbi:MAG: S8 family peptidase [Ignavibacteria bacterium]|nr:S8 family peptidase [Ignavibacteria bacterium]